MKVCFITDGGSGLGLGHVQQSIAFAQVLASESDVFFLTKSDSKVIKKISDNNFQVTWHKDDIGILSHLAATEPDVVIFDKIDVAEELAREIKQILRTRLVIFTNLSGANRYADIAVTADIGSHFENVRFVDDQTGTLFFYGPKYWVLRHEFYEYQRRSKSYEGTPKQILLMFGGSDPANLTAAALDQILSLARVYKINVILGALYGHDEELQSVLHRHDEKLLEINIYRNISNVAELMFNADLVIASPGLSAFEALRVGTPIIVVPHDSLQRDTYKGFLRMLERDELRQLGAMIETNDFTYPNDDRIVRMEIGEGIAELKDAIMLSNRKF